MDYNNYDVVCSDAPNTILLRPHVSDCTSGYVTSGRGICAILAKGMVLLARLYRCGEDLEWTVHDFSNFRK